MKNLKYILLLISIIACVQDNLPKPTKIGANTFGCKVDGREWIPNGGGGFSGLPKISADNYAKNLIINSYKSDKSSIKLNIVYPIVEGRIELKRKNVATYNADAYIFFETNENSTGFMIITKYDEANGIISGTFEFNGENVTTKEIKKITKGRFDAKF